MTLSQDPPRIKAASAGTPRFSATVGAKGANQELTATSAIATPGLIIVPDSNATIKSQVSLAHLTSYRVGGAAEWYIAPRHVHDLQASLEWARAEGLPITLIGAGSNLLVSDRGLPGLVICTRYLRSIHFNHAAAEVTAGAGEPIARLSWQVAEQGWHGLEWAVGIPGTVGGAVVMNAGAHGSCMANVLVSAKVLGSDGRLEVVQQADLGYAYRTSVLQSDRRIVVEATLRLQPGFIPEQVVKATAEDLEQRRNSQPYHLPSCGSVFRNPEPLKSARLIQQLGLKGHRIGGAQVSELHANFIVNSGGATAMDIYRLIYYVRQQVEQHHGITLEPEVKFLGEFDA